MRFTLVITIFCILVAAVTAQPGVVQLDSFAGATDDDKLTAALSYAQKQVFFPAIQFPNRDVVLNKCGRTPFSGMKLIGPGAPGGPKNLELSNGNYSNSKVRLNCGTNTSAWMSATKSLYDIYIGNLAFYGASTSQFWHQPLSSGTLYACQFDALTFFGFKHIFGNPTAKAAFTQVYFTGHWQVIGPSDTQFTIGGSDNSFWTGGYLNIGGNPQLAGANRYLMSFDSIGKTDVGKVYITAMNGWKGIKISGSSSFGKLNFFGGEFEGQNDGDPCHGTLIRVEGGGVAFFGIWTAYAMRSPDSASHGVIEVTGGNVFIERPTYSRGSTSNTVPFVYVSGGKVEVRSVHGISGLPTVSTVGTTAVALVDSSVTLYSNGVLMKAETSTSSSSSSNSHPIQVYKEKD